MSFTTRCLNQIAYMPEMFLGKSNKNRVLRATSPAKFFLLLALCIALLPSCKKETNPVGLGVLPQSVLLNNIVIDTTTLIAYTVREDSLLVFNTRISPQFLPVINMLGSYNDPLFGKTFASIYTQLDLPLNVASIDSFGNPAPYNNHVDSVVLVLPYASTTGYYGTLSPVTINVFELNQSLVYDSIYYSNQSFATKRTMIGSATIHPKPADSVTIGITKVAPHIRIRLPDSIGNNIINYLYYHPGTVIDHPTFQSIFPGLYITTMSPGQVPGTGSIIYLSLLNPIAGMTVYYRTNIYTPALGDTLSPTFSINSGGCVRFNHFDHDYSIADPLLSSQLNGKTTQGKTFDYVQSMGGLRTKILMPYIKNWIKKGPIAINKAEMVIKVYGPDTAKYSPISQLALVRDSLNVNYSLPDLTLEGAAYFGGYYDPVNKEYVFNIARFIQQILTNRIINYNLYLLASGSTANANRVVIGGPGNVNPAYRMQLRLSYTKVH